MNAAEKLAREIKRVTELKGRYEELLGKPNVMVQPAIIMMEAVLENACLAAGTNDAITVLAVLKDLEGFEK